MVKSYRNITILGGHKLAVSYAKKLLVAHGRGDFKFENLFCVTPDADAAAHTELASSQVIQNTNEDFLLDAWKRRAEFAEDDVLVPDHTAKHVMLQTYLKLVATEFPDLQTKLTPIPGTWDIPVLMKFENDALWAISHANWTCPADCSEPEVCPHTNGPRDWNFHQSLEPFLKDQLDDFTSYRFGCQELFAEICHLPFHRIFELMNQFQNSLTQNPEQKTLIATHSHCHGILGAFETQG